MFGGFHLAASTYAVLMQVLDMRHLKGRRGSWFVWLAPFLYVIIAGVEAVLAGTVVGLMYVKTRNSHIALFESSITNIVIVLALFIRLGILRCPHGSHSYGLL